MSDCWAKWRYNEDISILDATACGLFFGQTEGVAEPSIFVFSTISALTPHIRINIEVVVATMSTSSIL